ncbi:maleylacetoacetate isomerase [Asticcacaulis excentricus]|uniref:Maleylacetoacetate isomerase n=1 Tax=Asticcacaulis excentricus (strain ATCC 15261 / DSM 4724 / KCTC 12464 / NCIMB 9791 / VKM B-1370 / CB 48) TaxID=573065 RepID=E8RTV2_ASTEC|nr:maleylacetoacetate isomerase [Asticcacaulis excentricus]ADU14923.1 maleylacetoacetate isomerase [Asticcacaulis excentricus CB 48]
MKLHGYFRSSAAWRVRIALALKGLDYDQVFVHLRHGDQRVPAFLKVNPQGLVPALEVEDGEILTQSLAICEYLEEVYPQPPLLLGSALERARIRAFAYAIACEIHPVQNLRVLNRIKALGQDEADVRAWAQETIATGFDACEALLDGQAGPYCFGAQVTLADVFLVPQMANARRFGVELRWPRLRDVEAACQSHPAFDTTRPDRQPDAE